MKKIMLFAAACVALAACTKNSDSPAPDKATAFEKGQKVTLTVTNPQTKATSTLNTTSGAVDFKWETGDQILVKVGGESATFTVSKLNNGGVSAEFEGTMPDGGTTFDVQYPIATPDLSSQTYTAGEAIPHDMMLATATGCTIDTPFSLTAQNAALRLNLYGRNREVSQIVVTNTTVEPNVSYILNCTSAVRVGNSSATATPFLLVVPAGASAWKFKVEVTAGNATTNLDAVPTYTEGGYTGDGIIIITETFTTISDQTFSAGQILNMPAKAITTVWAPVNCGYVAKTGNSGAALGYPYGKLYQWGRKDGQGYYKAGSGSKPTYEDATYPSGDNLATGPISDISTVSAEKFYKVSASPYNWYSGSSPIANDLWKEDGSSIYDPCPEGWRVPTIAELTALLGSHTAGVFQDGIGVHSGMKGQYFDGSTAATPTSGVFLPAAGYRQYYNGGALDRGGCGSYWSSSVNNNKAWFMNLLNGYAGVGGRDRACGYSVRCVQE